MTRYLRLKRFWPFGVWLALLAGVLSTASAAAQATAVRGSVAKSPFAPEYPMTRVVVYGQPTGDLNNVLFENINVCVSIPDLGPANPKAFIRQNFVPALEWTAIAGGNPEIFGGRAYYTFIGNEIDSLRINWPAGNDNPILEISFKAGIGWDFVQLNDLSIGGIGSGGGPSGQSFWYVQANTLGDITDYDFKFYQSVGSQIPLNGGMLAPSAVETVDTVALPVKPALKNAVWQLFPNPVRGPLHLLTDAGGPALLQISDHLGRLVWEQKTTLLPDAVLDIPAAGLLAEGAYLLDVRALDGQRLYKGRFVVIRH